MCHVDLKKLEPLITGGNNYKELVKTRLQKE